MYELYVMRHAKSSWSDLNLSDFERPLNGRGKKNAKLMCEFFVKKKFIFDYVMVSSSKRTEKTLKIILKKLSKPKKIFSSKKLYLTNEQKIIDMKVLMKEDTLWNKIFPDKENEHREIIGKTKKIYLPEIKEHVKKFMKENFCHLLKEKKGENILP